MHPGIGHRCPRWGLFRSFSPAPASSLYLLPDLGISCQCKLRGSFGPEPVTHLLFLQWLSYMFLCVYICIYVEVFLLLCQQ